MRNDVIISKLMAYIEKLQAYCAGLTYEEFERDTKLAEHAFSI